jgi:hypothetical protein
VVGASGSAGPSATISSSEGSAIESFFATRSATCARSTVSRCGSG